MMKLVLKMDDMCHPKSQRETMKAVLGLRGIDCLAVDKEKKTLTVVGNVDPVEVVCKLRKLMHTEIESVGPNKVEEKEKKDEGNDVKINKELEEIVGGYYYHYNGYYPYYWPSN